MVHLIGIDRNAPAGLNEYLGDKPEEILHGGAAVDHLAFSATDLPAMPRRTALEAGLQAYEGPRGVLGRHVVAHARAGRLSAGPGAHMGAGWPCCAVPNTA